MTTGVPGGPPVPDNSRAGSGPPRRVRVTAPPRTRRRRTSVAAEIDAQSEVGEVYMRSLMRAQLRLAIGVGVVLVLTLGGLPLIFELFPAVGKLRLLGIPLPWWILGLFCYPVLLVLAWFYVRRANRHERAFRDLVER